MDNNKIEGWTSELASDDIDIEISFMARCGDGHIPKYVYSNQIKGGICIHGKQMYYQLIAFVHCAVCGKILMDFRDDPKIKEVGYHQSIPSFDLFDTTDFEKNYWKDIKNGNNK